MKKEKGYIIGNLMFKTKGAIKEHYTEMLKSYALDSKVNREDSIQLYHLLKYHPGFTEKFGTGINYFKVETAAQMDKKWHRERCFWIYRTDGTKIDFSIHECYRHKNQIEKVEL